MTIHVLVPVHNRLTMTMEFLTSLDAQVCMDDVTVTVIDDGSTDGTAEYLTSRPSIRVIQGPGHWWWAGSIARALAQLRGLILPQDWVYLGNNDTVLEKDHFAQLLDIADPNTVVGSVAVEVWPDGTLNPVSAGFIIDPEKLAVTNAGLGRDRDLDGLAGRGLLLPARALAFIRMHPTLMPQHFADLAFTADLKRSGFALAVATRARSRQLARAGSSVEVPPRIADMFARRSQIFLPALWCFWWSVSSPAQRWTLGPRFMERGWRQWRAGSYA